MTQEAFIQHAIRSWVRRQTGTWNQAEEADLQSWLADSAEHREAYEKVARGWELAGELQSFQPESHGGMFEHPSRAYERRRASIAGLLAAAACIVALLVTGTALFWSHVHLGGNVSETHLVTLKGQPKSFVLEDGTRVRLDANSELVARMESRRRGLTLVRGEALFNVVHDPSRPFEVSAGSGRIEDLGTHFDIEMLSSSTRVRVLEGKVAISTDCGRTLLVAGQSGGYDTAGSLDPVSSFDSTSTPWLEGLRTFDRERLGDVLERLARHHGVTFVFEDPRMRDLRISGTFRTDDLGLFLRTLAAALHVESRYLAQDQIKIASRLPRPNRDFHSNDKVSDPH
jgi:transmembrane sensor